MTDPSVTWGPTPNHVQQRVDGIMAEATPRVCRSEVAWQLVWSRVVLKAGRRGGPTRSFCRTAVEPRGRRLWRWSDMCSA